MSTTTESLGDPAPEHGWLASVCPDTEMGRLVTSFDWSRTPLGPPETWSIALRTAVAMCMSSRFPMLLVWGPQLIKIYNDGYRTILGVDKHPRALGAPAAEIWPEIWDEIGPMFDGVMSTGEPTWSEHALLVLERNGYPEECYFIWSYGAVYDDDGTIGGILDVVTETTDVVVTQRRLATLTELSAALFDAEQVTDVCLRAASALAGRAVDIRAADLYLLLDDELALVASNRRGDAPPLDRGLVADVARSGELLVIGDDEGGTRPAQHAVVPMAGLAGGVAGAVVLSLHPQRPFDDGYRSFVAVLARVIGSALDNAYRRSDQLGQHRRISETLQQAMLTPVSDLPSVAARYLPAVDSLAVGGDWYDVIDLGPDRRALVVGDCVGHGLEAATVMAQLRSAARAMLFDGRDPAGVLEGLDAFAWSTAGAACATVACAVIDRSVDVVTYARAGHPPPLLVRDDGARWLDRPAGPPLATDPKVRRTNGRVEVRRGDLLVMYSDGLVERRGESIDVGLDRLRGAAQTRFGAGVHAFADGLLRDLLPDGARDDVVLAVKLVPDRTSDRRAVADPGASGGRG